MSDNTLNRTIENHLKESFGSHQSEIVANNQKQEKKSLRMRGIIRF